AMTGEINLRGKVLPIGGLKEKVLAAYRAEIKTVLCPKENEKDLHEVPKNVMKAIEFKFVESLDEVLRVALAKLPDDHPNQPLRAFLSGEVEAKIDDWREVRDWMKQRKEQEERDREAARESGQH